MLARCGITDLAALAERCQTARQALGLSPTRWAAPCLLAAIQLALLRGWPPEQIQPALLTLAADRETRSPMRVAEAGPWWDQPPPPPPELDGVDLAVLEAELDDVAGPAPRPASQSPRRARRRAPARSPGPPSPPAPSRSSTDPDRRSHDTQPHSPSLTRRTTPCGHPSRDQAKITNPT